MKKMYFEHLTCAIFPNLNIFVCVWVCGHALVTCHNFMTFTTRNFTFWGFSVKGEIYVKIMGNIFSSRCCFPLIYTRMQKGGWVINFIFWGEILMKEITLQCGILNNRIMIKKIMI